MYKGYLAFKFRQHRVTTAFVTLGIIFFGVVMLLAYSAFDLAEVIRGAQAGQDIMKAMAGARGALTFDIAAFLGMVWRHPLVLVLVIGFAISLGSDFAASEIGEKTADLIFARPSTRPRLLYNHLLVTSGLLLAMISAFSLVVYSGASALGLEPPSPRLFVQASVQYFVFVLAVLGVAYLAGALASHAKTVLGVVGGLFSVMYAVELVGGLWTTAEPLLPFSLFTYLTPARALVGDQAAWTDALTLLAVAVVTLAATHVLMRRRDL